MTSQTFAFSGPNVIAGQIFTGRSKSTYVANSNGVWTNVSLLDQPDFLSAGYTPATVNASLSNISATADPVAGSDGTLGYAPGSLWINTTNGRVWQCQSSATGAALWALMVVPGTGLIPSSMLTQFGASAYGASLGSFTEDGNVYRGVSLAGIGNAADTTDDILFGIALPASVFDKAGRGIRVEAWGQTGATTNNKRAKIIFNATFTGGTLTNGVQVGGTASGGTVIADTGAWINATTPNSNVGWNLASSLFKVGAAASNTQIAQGQAILGATHAGVSAVASPTATESGIINICVTGSSYTTGAASDILANAFNVFAMN